MRLLKARLFAALCVFGLYTLLVPHAHAQDVKSSVESKQFVFQAQSMSPMKAATRQLDPGYSLDVKGETLICNLPYIGRVYSPTIGADAGLNFTSSDFEYSVKTRKKGGWDVRIKTKDKKGQRQFDLIISESGSASLTVTSSDRETVRYQGSVAK